ncbi:thiamine pyrophosphokinase [Echinicola sp. CAU 1574]|uniref:Thiamine pyrophosphokinase n=1 Tax=Echinicola arenosa TaxID=2774144 RepID=A0ABR9AJC2_9BACT|nr:thiamine pyrophosphokinase [Echinicola arenosa]MBD8488619.1 thiamine pyrophosphokinase [Echinicola arenosa]
MSSHHFVKEQQEPALLILKTEHTNFEKIAPLLEWVPTVLVAESEVDTVLSWGIKIDVILATTGFQKANIQLLEEQYPLRFMSVSEDNFLDEGLQYLIATKHPAVNIVGYDHQLAFDLENKLELINIVIFDGPIRYFPVQEKSFRKWFSESSIQLHAPEGTLIEVKRQNESQLVKVLHATFIEAEEGTISFQSTHPFWIGEMV